MSQDKKEVRVSLKGMTDDEKRERKRVLHREYMARRRKEDPEFAQRIRDNNKNRVNNYRKPNTPDAYDKETRLAYNRNYYNDRKIKLQELENLKKQLEIANLSLKIDSVSYF